MSAPNMLSEDRIDSWRQRVPSRLDREDPFEGDGFGERPATRLVCALFLTTLLKTNQSSVDFP